MMDLENHMVLPHADDELEMAKQCWCGKPAQTIPKKLGFDHLCTEHRQEKEHG